MTGAVAPTPDVVALVTSHNRREKTLTCLRSLHVAARHAQVTVGLVLVDAGSTDGTAQAVEALWPDADVRRTGDDVFWGDGMRQASSRAGSGMAWKLWLNDDVCLAPDGLVQLLTTAADHRRRHDGDAVVVGATVDSANRTSYSGMRRAGHALAFVKVVPDGTVQRVTTCNGNVVLWPTGVLHVLGDVDRHFPHAMGDLDLGLRASAQGFDLLLAPVHVGQCEGHEPSAPAGTTVRGRLRAVTSVKRLPPGAWIRFSLRHGGRLGPLYAALPYARAVAPTVLTRRQPRDAAGRGRR